MASRNAFEKSIILFIIFQLRIQHIRAIDKYHVNIPVFFNFDNIYQEFVFNSAVALFKDRDSSSKNESLNDLEVKMHFAKLDFSNLSSRANGLSSLIPKVSNLTASSQGAVFVDVTENSIAYSTFLESVSIPSIGLFRSQDGFPVTQVRWKKMKICCSCFQFTIVAFC